MTDAPGQETEGDLFPGSDADVQVRPFTTTRSGGSWVSAYVWETCSVWGCWSSWHIYIGAQRDESEARRFAKHLGEIHLLGVHNVVIVHPSAPQVSTVADTSVTRRSSAPTS